MTHTPKWIVNVDVSTTARTITIPVKADEPIIQVHEMGKNILNTCIADFCYSEDDARLIAAAPQLLEVLKVLLKHASKTYPHFESERGQIDINLVRAAIAAAEGKENV